MPKKDSHKDSTTDFFLNFITRQKEEKMKTKTSPEEPEVKENLSTDKAITILLKGINTVNILLDKMLS
jgi:hypothetical protein